MKKIILALAVLWVCGCTPKDPKEVIARVDGKIYYPQQAGMKSLRCRADTPYIGEMFDRLKKGKSEYGEILDRLPVETRFYWHSSYGSRFVISGLPKELPQLRGSIAKVFRGTDILIVPTTEKDQLDNFALSLSKVAEGLLLTGTNPKPEQELQKYELTVTKRKYLVLERKYYSRSGISYSRPGYEVWKGKRYLTRIETLMDNLRGNDLSSKVELEYSEVEGYWLVKKIRYSFAIAPSGERVIGPVEVSLEDCKINPPMASEIFKGDEVRFIDPQVLPLPGETGSPKKESAPGKNK
jgi:hypothetical protein